VTHTGQALGELVKMRKKLVIFKFVTHTGQALGELFKMRKKLVIFKFVTHTCQALGELFKMLNDDPDRAAYGAAYVFRAAEVCHELVCVSRTCLHRVYYVVITQ